MEPRRVLAATPVISEFLTSNAGGLEDSDGESADWIEIYNPTTSSFDLAGWTLTDDSDDLDKWTFPSTALGPAESLVVFASGKDRAVSGAELHTNFQLAREGEYLALVDPLGGIANEFAPVYPEQSTNITYGLQYASESLVQSGSQAKTLIPVDGSLATSWTQNAFDDSGWIDGSVGVGFGIIDPGFNVRYVKARSSGSFDGNVNSLTIAETVLATPEYQSFSVNERSPVINFLGTGGGGNYGNDLPFPTQFVGEDINHFVIEVTTTIDIPVATEWTFGVNSDDGFGLTLTRDENVYSSSFPTPRGAADTIATFGIQEAGLHELRLVMYEAAGGASVELFAAQGVHQSFSSQFDLVGDVDAGGLEGFAPYVAGQSTWVSTDVEPSMRDVNSSAYVRIPFDVADPNLVETLSLDMRFDDGFIAYINGTEVARQNAPIAAGFDASATASRDPQDVLDAVEFVLDDTALASLVAGENVLSIHGLNDDVSDDSFLVFPELSVTLTAVGAPTFFATPTPGELNRDPIDGVLDRVVIDVPAGFYETPQTVSILSSDPEAQIRYTIDGSEPTATNGMDYDQPLLIDQTTTLRAIAVAQDYVSLPSVTRTYLFLDDVLNQSADGSAPAGWPTSWGSNVVDYGMDPDVIASEGAAAVKQALLALPTISLTTDLDNLFDPQIGIYANAQQDGRDWERPASAEWLNPDGSDGFQINAGLRIRGGFSRSGNNPKHALKLFFRGQYGDSVLNYPVHGDAGVNQFKKLDLRTAQNYSWSFQGSSSNNFVAEVLARYNQRDLDQPYTRSTWIHLYLNGQYWGLYQTQERAEANFAESYFGGSADEYDVLKPERGAYQNIATDGNFDAYQLLWEQAVARADDGVTPAFVEDEAYLRAQGKNPDGSDNPAYPVLLDVDNLIVYMVETLRGGNLDAPISNFLGNDQPNNYFAIRNRNGREGFRYFQHDGEHTMRNVNQNRNGPWNAANYDNTVLYFNPQWLHQQLMANEEYRMRFADTVQFAFFNDGPLSETALIAKLDAEAAKIQTAVIAESARWGDAKRGDNSPYGQAEFLNAIAGLRNNYLPNRNPILINQFRNTTLVLKDDLGEYNVVVPAPLFPSIDAPRFLINGSLQHGGQIAEFDVLRIDAPDGQVHYTIDGSDPRMTGGGINPSAQIFDSSVTSQTVFAAGAVWSYEDSGTDLGTAWRASDYPDDAWSTGNAELGFGDGDETTVISFGADANNKHRTTYFRKTFSIDTQDVLQARLSIKRDDGVIVYLNGVEIGRDNMPAGAVNFNTFATSAAPGDGDPWVEFTIPGGQLLSGENVLAVEIHQVNATSSDLSFNAEMTLESQASDPILLSETTRLRARTLSSSGEWSALSDALFQIPNIPASPANVRLTEINYDPVADGDAEYLELRNISSVIVDLDGVTVTDGPSLPLQILAGTQLAPGESVVIVRDTVAFTAAYPTVDPAKIVGDYSGGLSNGGERIRIVDAVGQTIADLNYDVNDPWSEWADEVGGSLVLIDPANVPASETGKPYHYRGSVEFGGTPGAGELAPRGILINEVLAHTDVPFVDSVELFNSTDAAIDISGWFLSDNGKVPQKYRVPAGTVIPAFGYWVLDETHFNPAVPDQHAVVPFALNSSEGDSVWLFSGDGVSASGLEDTVSFDATYNGVSLGRMEGSAGRLVPLAVRSLGATNGTFLRSPVVISEVNYHPADPSGAALAIDPNLTAGDLEFIEVQNASDGPIDLTDWRLRGEGDHDFAPGTSLGVGETLVVISFDPDNAVHVNRLAAFRAHYGIDATVPIVGPFSGSLSNSHGIVKLQAPDEPPAGDPLFVPKVMVDEVFYDDLAPWPTEADGTGKSLQRVAPSTLGNYYDSWAAIAPTPGLVYVQPAVESVVINQDGPARSIVSRLTVSFDRIVDVDASSFQLKQLEANQEVGNLQVFTQVLDNKTVAEITFGTDPLVQTRPYDLNSLTDGTYSLRVIAANVTAADSGLAMAEDFLFGESSADQFFRLFGDADGDRDVDGSDLASLGSALFRLKIQPGFDEQMDFDGDGDVDGVDQRQVASRLFTRLGAP